MNKMTEIQNLWAEYVESGSEEAFRELVRRYINLVHSTALRLVEGDADLAKDVTQTVFIHLCRNAHKLPAEVMLGGWLHRDTCFVASKLLRQERRRQAREYQAALMNSPVDHSKANLEQVSSILDEAINSLGDDDRTAIVLRFFEQRDFKSLGLALNSNEDAARMRVSRALDKLHGLLKRRGVALSVSALAAGMTGEAVSAAPAGLAASIAGTALTASAAAGAISGPLIKTLFMTKLKIALVGSALSAGVAISMIHQSRVQSQLREQNQQLRQEIQNLAAVNEDLSNQAHQASIQLTPDRDQERELLKLRGEVGTLKRRLAGSADTAGKSAAAAPVESTQMTQAEYFKQAGIAKMNYTRDWMLAFFMYADKNGAQFPTNFSQALPFWPSDLKPTTDNKGEAAPHPEATGAGATLFGLAPDNYDLLYQGSMNALTNPQSIIVIREKDAWQGPNGGWLRAYAFADGHSEIHRAEDGNFLPWEQQHMMVAGSTPAGQ